MLRSRRQEAVTMRMTTYRESTRRRTKGVEEAEDSK